MASLAGADGVGRAVSLYRWWRLWRHGGAPAWAGTIRLQLSSLTLAILAGMLLGNTVPGRWMDKLHPGLRFSQQRLLRLGVVLYGLRLTLHDVSGWDRGPWRWT